MTTLAADKQRVFETDDTYTDLPVAASTLIYEGCAVGDNASGYMRKLVAGDNAARSARPGRSAAAPRWRGRPWAPRCRPARPTGSPGARSTVR